MTALNIFNRTQSYTRENGISAFATALAMVYSEGKYATCFTGNVTHQQTETVLSVFSIRTSRQRQGRNQRGHCQRNGIEEEMRKWLSHIGAACTCWWELKDPKYTNAHLINHPGSCLSAEDGKTLNGCFNGSASYGLELLIISELVCETRRKRKKRSFYVV